MIFDVVRSMLLPIENAEILLPNTAVAEIITYLNPKKQPALKPGLKTNWLLGMISWRTIKVPIVSIELFNNHTSNFKTPSTAKIAILNTTDNQDKLEFMGIVLQKHPKLSRITSSDIELIAENNKNIFSHEILVRGTKAYFVNFETIQQKIISIL